MLLINNQEVEKLFTMKNCLEALEDGYRSEEHTSELQSR